MKCMKSIAVLVLLVGVVSGQDPVVTVEWSTNRVIATNPGAAPGHIFINGRGQAFTLQQDYLVVCYTVKYVSGSANPVGMKDFHLWPDGKLTNGTPLWSKGADGERFTQDDFAVETKNGIHWYAYGSSSTPSQYAGVQPGDPGRHTVEFCIVYPGVDQAWFLANAQAVIGPGWQATSNGIGWNPESGDVIDEGLESRNGLALPVLTDNRGVQAVPADYARTGGIVDLKIRAPADAGSPYVMAASLGNTGFDVAGVHIPLDPDSVFIFSLDPNNPFTAGFQGTIDSSGDAWATILLPDDPGLVGIEFFIAAAILDPFSGLPYDVSPDLHMTVE